jgi:hypothetical protein
VGWCFEAILLILRGASAFDRPKPPQSNDGWIVLLNLPQLFFVPDRFGLSASTTTLIEFWTDWLAEQFKYRPEHDSKWQLDEY